MHIAERLHPVVHSPEDQVLIDRVNSIRTAAARILIKASVAPGYHPKPGFYDDAHRLKKIVEDAEEISNTTREWKGDMAQTIHFRANVVMLKANPFWQTSYRLEQIRADALFIIEEGRKLYPNQLVLDPPGNINWQAMPAVVPRNVATPSCSNHVGYTGPHYRG